MGEPNAEFRSAVGMGVAIGIALVLTPLLVPPCGASDQQLECLRLFSIGFVAIALPLAMTLGTFRLLQGRVRWWGARHGLVAVSVVVAIWLALFFVALAALFLRTGEKVPSVLVIPEFVMVVVLVALLSACLARWLLRWSAEDEQVHPTMPRWDPGAWGAAGRVWTAVSLVAGIILIWILSGMLRSFSSQRGISVTLSVVGCAGAFVVAGLLGLGVSIHRSRRLRK